jgi:hypothetical protein
MNRAHVSLIMVAFVLSNIQTPLLAKGKAASHAQSAKTVQVTSSAMQTESDLPISEKSDSRTKTIAHQDSSSNKQTADAGEPVKQSQSETTKPFTAPDGALYTTSDECG